MKKEKGQVKTSSTSQFDEFISRKRNESDALKKLIKSLTETEDEESKNKKFKK